MSYYEKGMSQVLSGEFNCALQIVIQQSLNHPHFNTFITEKLPEISDQLQIPIEIHRVYLESGFVGYMAEFVESRDECGLICAMLEFPYWVHKALEPIVDYLGYKTFWYIPKYLKPVQSCLEQLELNYKFPEQEEIEDWTEVGVHLSIKFVPAYHNQVEHKIPYRIISIDGDNYLLVHQMAFPANPSPSDYFKLPNKE